MPARLTFEDLVIMQVLIVSSCDFPFLLPASPFRSHLYSVVCKVRLQEHN